MKLAIELIAASAIGAVAAIAAPKALSTPYGQKFSAYAQRTTSNVRKATSVALGKASAKLA